MSARFVLQPSALPADGRMSANLEGLLHLAEKLSNDMEDARAPADDFADVCLRVEGRLFRCVRFPTPQLAGFFSRRLSSNYVNTCAIWTASKRKQAVVQPLQGLAGSSPIL